MNYFAHARPFLEKPYFAVATGVPDMLMVVDRTLKVRLKHTRPYLDDPNPIISAVASGIAQHLHDDHRFHRSAAFAETSMALTLMFRDALGDTTGLRPRFLGHLLTELLLDATVIQDDQSKLDEYYAVMESVDPLLVQQAFNHIAPRPTERLSSMITGICRERFLWDYLDDEKLTVRVNQILRRVGLDAVSDNFTQLLDKARRLVTLNKNELLEGIPTRRDHQPNA